MRVRHRDLARTAARVEENLGHANAAVTWIKINATIIAARANDDIDDGIRGVSYEPTPRGSDISDPVGRKATGPADPVTRSVVALATLLKEADHLARQARLAAERAENTARSLLAIDADVASQLAGADQVHDNTEGGKVLKGYVCGNLHCQAPVSNTANDRLRSGRCMACHRYRLRTGEERPAHLCAISSGDLEQLTGTDGLGLDHERLLTSS